MITRQLQILIVASAFCLASPAAFSQIILFSDDFESGNFLNPQGTGASWTITQPTVGIVDVQNAVIISGTETARMFDDSSTGVTAQAVASFSNTSAHGSLVDVSLKLQPVNEASFSGVLTLRSGLSTNAVRIRFLQSSSSIQYESASNVWTTLMPYTSGTTYDIALALDFNADTYDITINSAVVASDLNMLNALDGFDRLSLASGLVAASEGTFYFDDVVVSVPEPGAASLLLGALTLAAITGRRRVGSLLKASA